MPIELWAAVDDGGEGFVFSHEPVWDSEKQVFSRTEGHGVDSCFGDFLAARLCRDLKPGEKARVVSIDLANDVVVLDRPETAEQKFARVMEALREWNSSGDCRVLLNVYRDLSKSEVKA